jgi:hypothetical protein
MADFGQWMHMGRKPSDENIKGLSLIIQCHVQQKHVPVLENFALLP